MSKRNRERRQGDEGPRPQSATGGGSGTPTWLPTVLSFVALAFCVFLWMDQKRAADGLKKIEERVTVLTTQLASAQANRPQPRPSGPDPNRVYPVNIAGAPTKGNPNAPIVIAEFSEFQ